MNISLLALVKGVSWTVGAYGIGILLRIVTNIALARLLAPELFGIMVIVNSLRTGVDLVSDLGIGQNVVQSKNGDEPDFYNTAWTLQLIRGLFLFLICFAAAAPLARLYNSPILGLTLPVAAFYFLFLGFSSISVSLLQRRLQVAKLNIFEASLEFVSAAAHVMLAYLYPTVWALVFGGLCVYAARMVGSYFLLPTLRQRLYISKQFAFQIFTFGKWIFLSSIVYFLSMNFDRLYLGKVAPLELLGIYGIARTLSSMIGGMVRRLGDFIVFPLVASSSHLERGEFHKQLAPMRLKFLVVAAIILSVFASTVDLLIASVYDQRYQAAGWMVSILVIGVWFSIICSLNESMLLGFGRPLYAATADILKCGWLAVGLSLGFIQYGVFGAVMVVALSDLCRYMAIYYGQVRERFSFGAQDLLLTLLMAGLVGFWECLRWALNLGTSFDGLLSARLF